MTTKYNPLPTAADLSVVSLEAALRSNPTYRLHINAANEKTAHAIVQEPEFKRFGFEIVIDDRLNPHEWYVRAAVGSPAI